MPSASGSATSVTTYQPSFRVVTYAIRLYKDLFCVPELTWHGICQYPYPPKDMRIETTHSMTLQNIIILGAGPCGLSAAIALAKKHAGEQRPPLRITIIELRSCLQTIGGAINLTPIAMRYIDYLGAGKRLRERAVNLENGIDYVSIRSGKRIGNIWGGIGAVRVARHRLVESLLQTVTEEYSDTVHIQWDRRVAEISQSESNVVVRFEDGGTLTADVLLGCDGLHSAARRLWVEPERTKIFTGRVITMGWSDQPAGMTLSTGE